MITNFPKLLILTVLLASCFTKLHAQKAKTIDTAFFYQTVQTYTNPILPGDHPDPTLLKVGDDFYYCGSTFHFNPYLPIYHSKDLIHWEVISRVLPAAKAKWVTDRPSAGIWQGAITYFYGSFWIYFSAGGQWFSKASSPAGPWSDPVKVNTNAKTGDLGYDNSIFVDDGKPYMVIKNMQKVNRLQALGKDGQLTDSVINLDWINAKLQYSWAEGPVMCKRNGYYYYFPAGDVSGGQYVLRTTALTSDSTKWERLGDFFKPITDQKVGFRRPNHIAAPFQLADGTWWTIGQSYEKYDNDDWSGMGRQTSLYPITWEGDRPWGMAPTTKPIIKPNLPYSSIHWRSVKTDYFETNTLGFWWHFLTKKASASYSLTARKGWIRLSPDTNRTHVMQKETDHFYTAVTRVDMNAIDSNSKAGIYLTNGNQKEIVRLFSGYDQGKKIIFKLDTATRSVPNSFGNVVWLKVVRNEHLLNGYVSGDGKTWTSLGAAISAVPIDKVQPNFNSWVGTSVGLFAEGKPADFDFFICKDGLSTLPTAGYSNYYGIKTVLQNQQKMVTNTSNLGGWLMLSGVELGQLSPKNIELTASAKTAGKVEIWLDDLQKGKLIATIPVSATAENTPKAFTKSLQNVTGQHDVFIRFSTGTPQNIYVKSIRFLAK
jgi:xylan 1,4-beta-xylosidase